MARNTKAKKQTAPKAEIGAEIFASLRDLENLTCNCDHGSTDEEKYALIGQMIDAYKDKEGSLIQVLHAAQEIYGYLPLELQKFIALRMNKPLSEVNGVVSFYSFFSTHFMSHHFYALLSADFVHGWFRSAPDSSLLK